MLHHVVHLLEDILITEIMTIFQKSLHDHNTGAWQLNKKGIFFQSPFLRKVKKFSAQHKKFHCAAADPLLSALMSFAGSSLLMLGILH
jgi:hypothetical protein